MGFNTVVLVLNDHMSTIRESPKTFVWASTHPPHSLEEEEQWWKTLYHVADGYNERRLTRSALKVLPTFHADDQHYIAVGRNTIERVDQNPLTEGFRSVSMPSWMKDR